MYPAFSFAFYWHYTASVQETEALHLRDITKPVLNAKDSKVEWLVLGTLYLYTEAKVWLTSFVEKYIQNATDNTDCGVVVVARMAKTTHRLQ